MRLGGIKFSSEFQKDNYDQIDCKIVQWKNHDREARAFQGNKINDSTGQRDNPCK